MKAVKNIFAAIWAVWGMVWFATTLLIVLLPIVITGFFKEPLKSRSFWLVTRFWMNIYLPVVGCPLKIKGKEHFAKGENYIVTSNHNSFLDVPLTSPYIQGPNRTIAKIDMMKIPVFNIIYKRGSVLVDRKDPNSRSKSFSDMKTVLKNGWHVCIYPEGTRNKTSEPLQPFKDGAFRLAVETGKPIMPCLLFNTAKALPANKSFYFSPHRLQMHFLEPVMVKEGDTAESLKNEVHLKMKAYYEAHQ
jgi:1-acyl-sn-glycerol-3-phosphate acyltransferase